LEAGRASTWISAGVSGFNFLGASCSKSFKGLTQPRSAIDRPDRVLGWHSTLTTVAAAEWWATQEAARQAISERLRTVLGGPTQTFAALEKLVEGVLGDLRWVDS
jgi:hypothetical protein